MIAKMKGYPRMLLKTQDRKCSVGEEARMCMKISNLSSLTQNVDERKEDSFGRGGGQAFPYTWAGADSV
jgi:hypothetical protein